MERRTATLVIVTVLGVIAALRIADTYSELNATFDEASHLAAALQAYQQGRFVIVGEQPPLARWAIGLLPRWAGAELRLEGRRARSLAEAINELSQRALEEQGQYWKTLTLARLGTLFFLPILVVFTYRWAAAVHGAAAGWAAAALVTFSPNVLAHAGLATVDFALAACLAAAGYFWWRWLREPTLRGALIAGFASGLALATKYSALGFLPVVFVGLVICRFGSRIARPGSWAWPEVRSAARWALCALGVAVVTLWAAFGFEARPLQQARERPQALAERAAAEDNALRQGVRWVLETVPVPLQDAVFGLRRVRVHMEGERPSFLLGETGTYWWYYFPVVLGTKTTLPLLGLVLLAGVCAWRRGDIDGDTLGPLVGAMGILVLVMASRLNLGVRHILPVYPLLAIWASSCFRAPVGSPRRALTVVALLLVGWHVIESWRTHPDYLPYFNQSVLGREHEILGDSNLDWGQDLYRLARYVEANEIEDIALNYFGTTSPEAVGLRDYRTFGAGDKPRGWVAISLTHRQGIYQPRPVWLDAYEPQARIGKSIWVYFIE